MSRATLPFRWRVLAPTIAYAGFALSIACVVHDCLGATSSRWSVACSAFFTGITFTSVVSMTASILRMRRDAAAREYRILPSQVGLLHCEKRGCAGWALPLQNESGWRCTLCLEVIPASRYDAASAKRREHLQ